MTARTYILGLTAAFGLPWLAMVAIPYGKLKDLQPVKLDETGSVVYPPPNRGFVLAGHEIYKAEGCYQCHTQVVRPTYAGAERWRKGWAGETPRETQPLDYLELPYAPLGVQRIGPDLANVGFRITDPAWHFQHLYNPRSVHEWSVMPGYEHLFVKRRIQGQPAADAVKVEGLEPGWEVVPTDRARILVTYLLALRKDSPTAPAAK
jgi:cytochrome c oxidase cbb3-type subunit 2